ncbi:hypothetical protein TUMSATVNIG1_18840 [Vibrio nigripulchritudo]|uniref:hypothetical protein n=1 Tax=Vibrio nigripulchritudo TaxID=28173 RepID=UPI00190C9CDC|nr:hypothetical protein [Vibrio nigripulchritudo]BCL69928.1 hypothetical protein VNTUMSATTG_18650 [Vibrio nigripulchritudo]BDU31275.1 hypothetical protein TUMSATVNIG1_18840 [Vibrio nigripulchritudo]
MSMNILRKFIVLTAAVLFQGCASNTYEVNITYEVHIAPEKSAFDFIYSSVEEQVTSNPKSEFVVTPTEEKQLFCLAEEEPDRMLFQCMVFVPYYGETYCDDVVAFVDKEFSTLGVEMNTVSNSYSTCLKGEYSNHAKGGKTYSILEFEGDYSETKINWSSVSRDFGRLFHKGNCYLPSDIAADGSRCGKRAATARSGGY